MSCGRKECKRTFRGAPLYCRCSLEFCSEACFVNCWHTVHHIECPHAKEIKDELETRRAQGVEKSSTAQLVASALSRTAPNLGAAPEAVSTVAPSKLSPPPEQHIGASSSQAPVVAVNSHPASASSPANGYPASTNTPGNIYPASASSPATTGGDSSAFSQAKAEQKRNIQRFKQERPENFETIGDPLGSGSYGEVTKVRHRSTGEIYAMKAVPKKKILEQGMQAYLLSEVRTQIQLAHPNIVQLHYYYETEHNVLLLLEYASGGSLFSLLRRRGILPEHDAARYFADVAVALNHLHRHGIVHRDLKPENILMCGENHCKAKLADFGWCAELSMDAGAMRQTFCGTPDYLSPEMVQHEPHDKGVDIWAAGVLIYELLTGKPPFAASTTFKAMNRIIKVDLQVPIGVPPLATDLIQKLIVREPAKRLCLKEAIRHPWIRSKVPLDAVETPTSRTTPAANSPATSESKSCDFGAVSRPATQAGRPELNSGGSVATSASTVAVGGAPSQPQQPHAGSAGGCSFASTFSRPDAAAAATSPSSHPRGSPGSAEGSEGSAPEAAAGGAKLSTMPWASPQAAASVSSGAASNGRVSPDSSATGKWHETNTFAKIEKFFMTQGGTSPAGKESGRFGKDLDLSLSASRARSQTDFGGILDDTSVQSGLRSQPLDVTTCRLAASNKDGTPTPQPKRRASGISTVSGSPLSQSISTGAANGIRPDDGVLLEGDQGWKAVHSDLDKMNGALQGTMQEWLKRHNGSP
eukprot:TRINITY_DN7579_c0_g1_i1.p1 TRINITY_DN7579_c0_g1~~TRINITY_DN7579_c0_g1_i1.p1  ORF type:complete len:754 (-),score=122.50 TRINITY_DN7579_c0_g1_i1:97-2358(-)